ncbi:MAG: hypothetical protein ILP13_08130 [Lachnospiraceae bacterium]|nr:hypothetical protein [Lachnospiraceae bacterium]
MGFWKNLFRRKKINDFDLTDYEAEGKGWEDRSSLNLKDPVVREQYVMNCLDEMHEASAELDRINSEYALVTSYLTDMEDIENLPKEDKEQIEHIARHIHDLRKTHDAYVLKPSLMTEEEFNRMAAMEEEAKEGISKLSEQENYRDKVKSDLNRIDKERSAYDYRRREVASSIENYRTFVTIALFTAAVLIVLLLALDFLTNLNVNYGYYATIIIFAVALTVLYVKYTDRVSEKKRIDNTANELILLENKVKIRYVNNRNLLDYLYTKYSVGSAGELKSLYERYVKEKEDRRNFERNEAVYEDELARLIRALKNQKIVTPEIWIHQTDALYDSREMVEIRHRLIGRRQKLRKQLEYNEKIATDNGDEIKRIIKDYPESANSILRLVEQYER